MAKKLKGQKDYLAIAQSRVHRPKDITSYRKYLIYGRNKKGKTRFSLSNGIENTLHIDPEQGTDTMLALNPYVFPITRWEDMDDVWGALRTYELSPFTLGQGKSKKPFDTVAVDGCTKINNLALKYIGRVQEEADLTRRPGLVQRQDYFKSGELMKDFINNMLGLRMNVIFTAQEKMIKAVIGDEDEDEDEGESFFVPAIPDGVRGSLNSVVDVIGRIYVVRIEIKGKLRAQRRLQIGHHERYDTGYRSDHDPLPDVIKRPSFPKLTRLIETGELTDG